MSLPEGKDDRPHAGEAAERDLLRQQYIVAVRRNLTAQLEKTYIVEPDGTKHKLGRRETEETEQ